MKIWFFIFGACAFFWGCDNAQNNEQVIAVVGSSRLNVRDLEQALTEVSQFPGKDYTKPEHKVEVAKELIEQELLYQEALKANIQERSPEVKKEMVRQFLKEKVSRINYQPKEEDLLQFYNKNIAHFQTLPPEQSTLEFNKEKIRQYLIRQKQTQEIATYVDDLKGKAKIKFFPEHIPGATPPTAKQ